MKTITGTVTAVGFLLAMLTLAGCNGGQTEETLLGAGAGAAVGGIAGEAVADEPATGAAIGAGVGGAGGYFLGDD